MPLVSVKVVREFAAILVKECSLMGWHLAPYLRANTVAIAVHVKRDKSGNIRASFDDSISDEFPQMDR